MTLQSNFNLLNNAHKQNITTLTNQNKSLKFGTVSGYDPNKYLVQVTFDPYDQNEIPQTSWLPIASLHAGNARGIFIPPKVGDQAIVAFGDSSYQNGAIIGYVFNDEDQPVLVTSGNFLIQLGNGSDLSTIQISENGALTITASQTVTINAPAVTIGSENGDAGFLTKFAELKAAYDAHTHSTSGGESSPPSQPLTTDASTTDTKAS